MKASHLKLATLLVAIPFFKGYTQCTDSPVNCDLNLKQVIPGFSQIDNRTRSYAKTPNFPAAFTDVSYVGDEYKKDCSPLGNDCANNNTTTQQGKPILKYDVYYPKNHDYKTGCALPAIILFHAGGFEECSSRDQALIVTVCNEFAKRGFVTFNVEYRVGRIKDTKHKFTSVQQQLAVYRACQDGRGAIRSIIKRQMNENSGDNWDDPYRIDLTRIFVGGMSAGGIIALNAAWYTPSMVYSAWPSPPGQPTIRNVLGDIDIDYYYGSPADISDIHPYIKGVLGMWTGIPMPGTDVGNQYNFFSPYGSNLPPIITFQGKNDPVFPFYETSSQQIFLSPKAETLYNSEGRCLLSGTGPYTLDPSAKTADFLVGSTLNMYHIATHYGVLAELYLDCDMGHGLDPDCNCNNLQGKIDNNNNCVPCAFKSEFGTCLQTTDDVGRYMVQRAATFFQAVMNNKTKSDFGKTVFVECENKRNGCNTTTDNFDCNHHLEVVNNQLTCITGSYVNPCDSGVTP